MIAAFHVQAAVVAAFLLSALLAARLANDERRSDARVWRAAAWALAVLAVDRQLGLLDAVTSAAREAALSGGWYDERRLFQRWLVLGIGVAGLAGFAAWLRRRRPLSIAGAATVAAVGFLVCLALARASSQHRVDAFLRAPTALGLRWQPLLELLGAAVAAAGAVAAGTAIGGAARGASAQRLPKRP